MKKIYSYMFATVAMFALVACEKEFAGSVDTPMHEVPADAIEKTFTVSLTDEEPEVKTIVSGTASLWSGTENIAVLGNYYYNFSATLETPSASAEFSCDAYSAGETAVLAIYPYADDYKGDLKNKTVSNVVIPSAQYVAVGAYANDAHIAIAYSEDGRTLQFKNAVALFKFTIQQDNIKKVCLFASEEKGDCVSGTGVMSYNNGEPTFAPTKKNHWVDIYPEKGKTTFTKGTYYFTVAPGVYANGFTIEVETGDGNKVNFLSTTKSQNFAAGLLFDLGEIKLPTVPVVMGDFNNWTVSRTPMSYVTDKYYVAKNITIAANQGFKIRTADNKWISIKSLTTGKWHPFAFEDANMKLEAGNYDIYCDLKNEMICVVKSNTTVPDFILFKPSSKTWASSDQSNYRFAVYFYNDAKGKNYWYSLNEKTSDGFYYASVEGGVWPNLIICRMWGDNANNAWSTKREQTANLTMPTTNKRCFNDTSDWWSNQNDGWWNTKK